MPFYSYTAFSCRTLYFSILVVFVLGGCQTTGSSDPYAGEPIGNTQMVAEINDILDQREIPTEALLDADGNWNLVEQKDAYDPAAEHMKARINVDTGRRTKMASLSAKFDPDVDSEQDKTFRVLRVQKDTKKDKSLASLFGLGGHDEERANLRPPEKYEGYVIPEKKPKHEEGTVRSIMASLGLESSEPQTDTLENVVVPDAKPRPGLSYSATKTVIPSRKPVRPNAQSMIALNDIQPSAGGENKRLTVVPKQKPVAERMEVSGKIPVPKVKTDFKPVNLKTLKLQTMSQAGRASIVNLRSGEHAGKTRIVLEVDGDPTYQAQIDTGRRVLVINFSSSAWEVKKTHRFNLASVAKDYRVSEENGSVRLEISLRKNSKILQAVDLGQGQNGLKRIVLDLKNG